MAPTANPVSRPAKRAKRTYTTGELNVLVDALLHPLVKRDPSFLIVDGILHSIVEQNPHRSTAKFVQYNLPKLIAALLRKQRRPQR